MDVGFIGLGKLGMPCAEVMAEAGHIVHGYDVVPRESTSVIIEPTLERVVDNSEMIFIAVPTGHQPEYDGDKPSMHLPPRDFDYSIVKKVLTQLDKLTRNKLIIIISTMLPGTMRNELAHLMLNDNIVYNPYLIAMGSVKWDMKNPEMIMLGTKDGYENYATTKLQRFYASITENNPRVVIGTWDECESIKVFYNTFISAKIGLVNMIQDVAERVQNINVDVVTEALAESTQRITGPAYMKAGMGDGGACHPRDNIALRYLAEKYDLGYDLFEAIMFAREKQAENLAGLLTRLAVKHRLPIYIYGRTYKPGVPYTAGSYATLVGEYCVPAPIYVDPRTQENVEAILGVVLLAHPISSVKGATQYAPILKGSVVVDPWRMYGEGLNKIEGIEIIHYGNTRQPVDKRSSSYSETGTFGIAGDTIAL